MSRGRRNPKVEVTPKMLELVELFEREVERRIGRKNATFEQRQDARVALVAEALAKANSRSVSKSQRRRPKLPRVACSNSSVAILAGSTTLPSKSLHRTGSQLRLKLPGAKWLPHTSQAIFNIRMMRLAGNWNHFWTQPDIEERFAAVKLPN